MSTRAARNVKPCGSPRQALTSVHATTISEPTSTIAPSTCRNSGRFQESGLTAAMVMRPA